MNTIVLKSIKNKAIIDIGRYISENEYDKCVNFNDYDGEIFMSLDNEEEIIIKPFPTLDGDKLILYDNKSFNSDNLTKISFKASLSFLLNTKIVRIDYIYKYKLFYEFVIHFDNGKKARVFLNNTDEVNIDEL